MAGQARCRLIAALWLLQRLALVAGLRGRLPAQSGAELPPDLQATGAPDRKTILVVVNVHEKPDVAALQLENINSRLQRHFQPEVALSCNQEMYQNLSRTRLPPNVHLNPQVIEKRRFTGLLLKGIVSNLRFLAARHNFSYALVLSSKSRIQKDITAEDVADSIEACHSYIHSNCSKICHLSTCESEMRYSHAVWRGYRDSLLGQHVLKATFPNGEPGLDKRAMVSEEEEEDGSKTKLPVALVGGIHEGLLLDHEAVVRMLRFLDDHREMELDLYNSYDPMEEFALHTLAVFLGGDIGFLGHSGHRKPNSFYKIEKVERQVASFTEGYGKRPPRMKGGKAVKTTNWFTKSIRRGIQNLGGQ